MAITLVDWLNDGTLPQNKTAGNWTPSAFNTGKFRQVWTPTNGSSHSTWRPPSLTYWALLSTNDANGGGIWLEWNPAGGGTHTLMVVSAATGSPISGATKIITWSAGQAITYTVDQSSATTGASALTVAGAATGDGTSSGYTRENILTGANLYLGAWGSGGFGLVASTFGDIDDGNDSVNGALTATLGTLTGTGAGVVGIAGAAAPTLGALTSDAAGTVAIAGAASPTLGTLTVTATGEVPDGNIDGALSATLGSLTAAAAGTVAVAGAASPTLGNLTTTASGQTLVAGQLAATLGALTVTASDAASVQLGAYDGQRVLYGTAAGTVTTESFTTANGSTFLICTGGNLGDLTTAPTDSKGNTYTHLQTLEYTRWAGYGIALWICVDGIGGTSHTFSQQFGQTLGFDEMTICFAEVQNGHHLQGYSLTQALTGNPLTSGNITTSAEALLVGFFSGDAPTGTTPTVSFSNGYTLVDSDTFPDHPNGYVPIGIAYVYKSAPGTYGYTATESPDQGAIMVNVALQRAAVTGASLTATLGTLTTTAAGGVAVAGTAAPTLGALTSTAAGVVTVTGAAAPQLGTLSTTGTGAVAVTGGLNVTLGSLSLSASSSSLIATIAQQLLDEGNTAMLIPVPTRSDALSVGATSAAFATLSAMVRDEVFLFSCNVACYIAQGATPTASAGAGSMYVPAGLSVLISGRNGARLAVIRESTNGLATLTPVQEL